MVAELPFILMHPKPIDEPYGPPSTNTSKPISEDEDGNHKEDKLVDDHNLIQLDA